MQATWRTALRGSWLLAAFVAGPAHAQCPAGTIGEVHVEPRSIFGPETLEGVERLRWAYELANTVHITTREEFIRGALLFRPGECLDPASLEESARVLREFRFIANAEIESEAVGGGEVRVSVRTRDEWTTKLALNLRLDDGVVLDGASLFEENFLGRGVTLGVFGANRGARREAGGALEIPGIRGSATDLILRGRQGLAGGALRVELVQPFRGEREGVGVRQSYQVRRDLFDWVLPDHAPYSHLVARELSRRMEVSVARRVGGPGDLYMVGAGLSYERVSIEGPAGAELVEGGDFASRAPASTEWFEAISAQTPERYALRAGVLAGLRRLSFRSRDRLDALGGLQDVPVGRELQLALGRSLGPTGEGSPGDVHARFSLLAGGESLRWVSQVRILLEGRREDGGPERSGMWRDVLGEAHAFLYLVPERRERPTVVLALSALGGWRTSSPFQLTLGGVDGMRGFRETDFPGGRKAIATVEARAPFPGTVRNFADVGVGVFGDVGASWRGDAPFGVDSGVRGTLGVGLRVGFPAGTSSVIRFDVAFPVGAGTAAGGPILRISAREWIGLSADARNPQVERSRRSGLSGQYQGAARDGGVP